MAGQTYYVCVDSFNENGVTTGEIIKMEAEPCPQRQSSSLCWEPF